MLNTPKSNSDNQIIERKLNLNSSISHNQYPPDDQAITSQD